MNKRELDTYRDEMSITVGHDAEVFLKGPNGGPVSSIGKVGGSKEFPRKTPHGWVQEDCVTAEVNIEPAHSLSEFVEPTLLVLDDLLEIIKPLDLSIDICASRHFPREELMDPLATLAGCEEDYDAYLLDVNPKPDYETTNIRGAGGHIHLGWKGGGEDFEDIINVVKSLEFHLVLPSVLLDDDRERRSLYGMAGAHRPKSYGVEVRSPSNFWLRSREYIEWAYYASINSIKLRGNLPVSSETIRDTINSGDRASAYDIVKDYNIALPQGVCLNGL